MTPFPALLSLFLAQSAATPVDPSPSDRTLAAAERAAIAAERAAAAAQMAAEAAKSAVQQLRPPGALPEAVAAPMAAPKPPTSHWTGTAGLALISLSGNANTLTFNGTVNLDRKWEVWALGFKAFGTYGQTRLEGTEDAQVVALAAGVALRGDRKVAGPVTVFSLVGLETNHVKSVEEVGFVEAGTGITWAEVKEGELQKLLVRTDVALRYAREYRFQYYPFQMTLPTRDLLGPKIGVAFRYALSKDVIFSQDAELVPNLLGESRLLVSATTKLSSHLTESLSLGVSFRLDSDSRPAPGKVPTDSALTVGVEVAL